jgi:hypothetical protein
MHPPLINFAGASLARMPGRDNRASSTPFTELPLTRGSRN